MGGWTTCRILTALVCVQCVVLPCRAADPPAPNSQPGATELAGFNDQADINARPGFGEQPGFDLVPSLALGEVYDDNIFSSASAPQQDHILRLSPALDASYLSDRWQIHSDISFDAERYRRHPDLDSDVASRHAALELEYLYAPRLSFGLDTGYTTTNNPGGLALNTTGLVLGRVSARFFTAEPSGRYRLDPLTTGKFSYRYEEDEVEGGLKTETSTATLGLAREYGPRDALSLDYATTSYHFGVISSATSEVLTLGWTHALTPATRFTLKAGPRDTAGHVTADVTASLDHDLARGALTALYALSETVVLGEVGPVDTRMVGLSAWYAPTSEWEFEAAPSYLKDTRGTGHVAVYRMNLGATCKLGERTYLVSLYQYGLQQGTLDLPSDQQINRATVYLGLVFYFGNPLGVGAADLSVGRPPLPWGT